MKEELIAAIANSKLISLKDKQIAIEHLESIGEPKLTPSTILMTMFIFGESPQGFDFWNTIADKLRREEQQ